MKYLFYIALGVLAILCLPLLERHQRHSLDTQAMRKLLRSAWIDDSDLSLEIDSDGEEIFTFTATDDQFYYLLKREDIPVARVPSYACGAEENRPSCSDAVQTYHPGPKGIGLPGRGHPEIFVLSRLPKENRVEVRIYWYLSI